MLKLTFAILALCVMGSLASPYYRHRHIANKYNAKDPREGSRIVNGEDVEDREFKFQISFQTAGGFHFCGGIVYNKDFIICASHCIDGTTDNPTGDYIIAGIDNLSSTDNKQRIQVDATIRHASYSGSTFQNDISLIRLSSPLDFSDGNVAPITLPVQQNSDEEEPYTQGDFESTYPEAPPLEQVGDAFYVTGWGTLSPGGSSPDRMQKVLAAYVTDEVCNFPEVSGGYDGDVYPSMICAGGAGGNHDSCQGDSGGPMTLATRPDVNTPFSPTDELVGIVSWGRSCALDGYPGVYTQVSWFTDWVKRNADNCLTGSVENSPSGHQCGA